MATVRITNDIRYYVRNKIDTMFRQRIEEKQKELNTLDIGTACYEKYVSPSARKLIAQLNEDPDGAWVNNTTTTTIQLQYTGADHTPKSVNFIICFKPPVPLPLRYQGYGRPRFELTPEMGPYEHAKKILFELDQLSAEREILLSTIVDGVLTKCSTLRQVLEVWPTALDFFPDTARHQHYTKAEKRNTNPAADIEIDDAVKIALMKARMTSGT